MLQGLFAGLKACSTLVRLERGAGASATPAGARYLQPQMLATEAIGFIAGLLTTASNVPQVLTTWRKRSGEGLSFRMLLALACGLALWIAYGVARTSVPLILFNAIALVLVLALIGMKLRFDRRPTKD